MASILHPPHDRAANSRRKLSDHAKPAPELIAGSVEFEALLEHARKVADYDLTALITGESGTGKTTLAKYIHFHSMRRNHPLVVINCATPREHSRARWPIVRVAWRRATVARLS